MKQEFKLPDGSHSLHNIPNYFQYTKLQIYLNKIESRRTLKLKNGNSFELLALKTREWLGNNQPKITQSKNEKILLKLEELMLHFYKVI